MSDLTQFEWGDLDGIKGVRGHTISNNGDTALLQLDWLGGPNGRDYFVTYSVGTESWGVIEPSVAVQNNSVGGLAWFEASDDLSKIAFVTRDALTTDDLNRNADVYLLDPASGALDLVFNPATPAGPNVLGDLSGDGETVIVLSSERTNAGYRQAELFDLDADTRESLFKYLDPAGYAPGDTNIRDVRLSEDGRFVGVMIGDDRVLRIDRQDGSVFDLTGETGGYDGLAGDGFFLGFEMSGNGRYLLFTYDNSFGDREDGLVRVDTTTGALDYVYNADFLDAGLLGFSISDDGRYVAFVTSTPDLVAEDSLSDGSSRDPDLFVRDMGTGQIQLLAADDAQAGSGFSSMIPKISGDGTQILINTAGAAAFEGEFGEDIAAASVISGYGRWLPELAGVTRDGTAGNDNLSGTDGPDTLRGFDGNDTIRGLDGADVLEGGDGADTINGGDGDDLIRGGATDADLRDVVFAGDGNDSVDGGHGNDELYGQDGNDTLAGGFGVDTVQGQDGDDVITGSAFSDLVFGGDGDDFVNGGFGSDRINGGDGADRFFHVGVSGHGSDWIQDYSAAEGDVLLFGGSGTAGDFQVNFNHTENAQGDRAGDDAVQEAFVIFRPTGQILWALVDGGGESSITLQIGGDTEVYDLLG